jgi:hypothetical protein
MMGIMMPETCCDTNKYIILSASGWLFIHLHYKSNSKTGSPIAVKKQQVLHIPSVCL